MLGFDQGKQCLRSLRWIARLIAALRLSRGANR
jgi:hypothetical protein